MQRLTVFAAGCLALGLAVRCVGPPDCESGQGADEQVAGEGRSLYFVDCSAAVPGDGSESKPWNSLAMANRYQFSAGESLLFKRGAVCEGSLNPQGSGAPGAPIVIDSYGDGSLPIISAGENEYAIKLANQSYWEIRSIETTGGTRYGIFVTVDATVSEYIFLKNVVVHDVFGEPPDSKNTGLVVVSPTHDLENTTRARFNDIVLDNVTAYNTNQWAGILVGTGTAADGWASDVEMRSSNVTVRNSTVHDTYGDGIVLFAVNGGLVEHSVAYRTGLQPEETIGTPNAIWTWSCMDCTVQFTEAYDNHSPGVDGGAYDIDWGNANNIVQYNFGHHNSAYCIAIFGAAGLVTTNSIVRYNICAYNGADSDRQNKEIEITTWDGGMIDGLQIYNNTIYTRNGVFNSDFYSGGFSGALPRFFKNNIVYVESEILGEAGALFEKIGGLERDHNLYFYPDSRWTSGEPNSVHKVLRFQLLVGKAKAREPRLLALQPDSAAIDAGVDVCAGIAGCSMGGRDFFGATAPQGKGYDIGAYETDHSLDSISFAAPR